MLFWFAPLLALFLECMCLNTTRNHFFQLFTMIRPLPFFPHPLVSCQLCVLSPRACQVHPQHPSIPLALLWTCPNKLNLDVLQIGIHL